MAFVARPLGLLLLIALLGIGPATAKIRYKSLAELRKDYPIPSNFLAQLRQIRDKETLVKLNHLLVAEMGGLQDIAFLYRYKKTPFTPIDQINLDRAVEANKTNLAAVDARFEELGFSDEGAKKTVPSPQASPPASTLPRKLPAGSRASPRIDYMAKARDQGWTSTFQTYSLPKTPEARPAFVAEAISADGLEHLALQREKRAAEIDSTWDQAQANNLRRRAAVLRKAQIQPGLPRGTGIPDWAAPVLQAARFGDEEAQAALGDWGPQSEEGFQMPLSEAIAWLDAAAKSGHQHAEGRAEELRKRDRKRAAEEEAKQRKATARAAALNPSRGDASGRPKGFPETLDPQWLPGKVDAREKFVASKFTSEGLGESEARYRKNSQAKTEFGASSRAGFAATALQYGWRRSIVAAAQVQPGLPEAAGVPDWAEPIARAARFGDPEAQYGLCYWGKRRSQGLALAPEEVLAWCEAAAELGHPKAEADLSSLRAWVARTSKPSRPKPEPAKKAVPTAHSSGSLPARPPGFPETVKWALPTKASDVEYFMNKHFTPKMMRFDVEYAIERSKGAGRHAQDWLDQAQQIRWRTGLIQAAQVQPGLPPAPVAPKTAAPLLAAARYGDPEAQFALAELAKRKDLGFDISAADAGRWMEAAASQGHPKALRATGGTAAPRAVRSPASAGHSGPKVTWEETATHRIKIKTVDGKEVGRWEFPKAK